MNDAGPQPEIGRGERRPPPPAWLPAAGLVGVLGFLCVEALRKYLTADPATPEGLGDFKHFYYAAEAARLGAHVYESYTGGYLYMPMLAAVLAPLTLLPVHHAGAVVVVVNTALALAVALLAAAECLRRFRGPPDRSTLLIVALGALLLVVDKLRSELRLGQTDLLVLLGYVLALRWLGRRPVLSGLALAVAMNVKYQSLIFLPYLLVRRRWTEAASMTLGSMAIAFGGALVWGWERNLDYLGRALASLAALLGRAEPFEALPGLWPITWYRSVSMPSVMARLADAAGVPRAAGWAGVLVLAALALAAGWWLYATHGRRLFLGRSARADDAPGPRPALVHLEWTGLIVALMAFSPQTIARHLVQLVPMTALVVMLLAVGRPGVPRRTLTIATAAFVLALVFPPGGEAFEGLQRGWQSAGMPIWGTLAVFFAALRAGLRWVGTMDGPAGLPALGAGGRGGVSA